MDFLSDIRSPLKESAFMKKIAAWTPSGNGATITSIGSAALSGTGTTTNANVATTNLHQSLRRIEYLVTVAATTAVAGFRCTAAQWWRGNAAGLGGFYFMCQWGATTGVATATNRAFVGMSSNTSAPTDVEPSSLTTMIGMGWDAADTNVQMYSNDNTGAATKIALGASFPVPTSDRTAVYEIKIFCQPNGSGFNWQVKNLVSGAVASGTITTNIPAATDLLSPRGWMSVGGTSSVIGIALMDMRVVTDI